MFSVGITPMYHGLAVHPESSGFKSQALRSSHMAQRSFWLAWRGRGAVGDCLFICKELLCFHKGPGYTETGKRHRCNVVHSCHRIQTETSPLEQYLNLQEKAQVSDAQLQSALGSLACRTCKYIQQMGFSTESTTVSTILFHSNMNGHS